jgi:hypothetical protein
MLFRVPHFDACNRFAFSTDVTLMHVETFSCFSSGRAENFLSFKMDLSCVTKVFLPDDSLDFA